MMSLMAIKTNFEDFEAALKNQGAVKIQYTKSPLTAGNKLDLLVLFDSRSNAIRQQLSEIYVKDCEYFSHEIDPTIKFQGMTKETVEYFAQMFVIPVNWIDIFDLNPVKKTEIIPDFLKPTTPIIAASAEDDLNKLKRLLTERFGGICKIAPDADLKILGITPDTNVQCVLDDLEMDSLDEIEALMMIEEEFGAEITDDEATKLATMTIGEMFGLINGKLRNA